MLKSFNLKEIPETALPLIAPNEHYTPFYNESVVKEVFKFKGLYRISTNHGQFRVEDAKIEIL